MTWLLALFEDWASDVPDAEDAVAYAQGIGDPPYPVLADFEDRLTVDTPWDGHSLPGKCVLSPKMEILHCYAGADSEPALQVIRDHHEATNP